MTIEVAERTRSPRTSSSVGRPRDPIVHAQILDAAALELADVGLTAISLSGVAKRAGVSKTSVTRRWSNVGALVADLLSTPIQVPEVPDVGDLHAELDQLSRIVAERMTGPDMDRQLRFTLDASRSPELFARYQDTYARPLAARTREVMGRAVRRGLVPPGTDIPVLSSAFLGALLNSSLARGCIGPPEADRQRIVLTFARLLGPAYPPVDSTSTGPD